MIKLLRSYFSKFEIILWSFSVLLIIASFIIFDKENYIILCASIIGVTSLIFNAKGNPLGQLLMIIFSVLYGIISFSFAYYGEMITYLGMTAPMALISLISWIKNPYDKDKSEVKVEVLNNNDVYIMLLLTCVVTFTFYFVLKAFNTSNIITGTVSVSTSFAAVYLTYRRSPLFAVAYAANDIVLIILWVLAAAENSSYFSVIICFAVFLVNDFYGYFNWLKIKKRQNSCEQPQFNS